MNVDFNRRCCVFSIVIRAFIALVDTILFCVFHCYTCIGMVGPLLHYRQYGTGGVLNEYSLHSYMNRIDKGGGDDIIIRVTQ